MVKFIDCGQVYLRPLNIDDVNQEYLNWLNDKDVTLGLASGAFATTLLQLENYVASKTIDKNTIILAICDSINDQHIGNIKLDNFDWVAATCELGILIGNKNFWNKNIGFIVCSKIIEHAFVTLNIRKILLAVYANNPNATELYKKIGFEIEGQLKQHVYVDGKYIDKILMSLFNPNINR